MDPQARQGVPRSGLGARQSGQISWELCVIEVIFRLSNASSELRAKRASVLAVNSTALFGPRQRPSLHRCWL